MALAFDAVGGDVQLGGSTLSYPHTCSGSNRILHVGVNTSTGLTVSGVTYNSVAMTEIPTNSPVVQPGGNILHVFELVNPAVGAHNVAITLSGSDTFRSVSISHTGAKQTAQPDNSAKATQTSLDHITNSLTPVAAGSWILAFTANTVDVASNGTNYTNRNNSAGVGVGDTNGGVSGATSQTVNASGSADWGIIQVSIAPVPSTQGGAFLNNFI